MAYGDKRDYRKIDIYRNGSYCCSTTWSRTCREAIERHAAHYPAAGNKITARFV